MFAVIIALDVFNGQRIGFLEYGAIGIILIESMFAIRIVRQCRRVDPAPSRIEKWR
jgi:hypothetical protein